MKFLLVVAAAICITGVYCGESEGPKKADVLECMNESKVDLKLFDGLHTNPNFVPTREMHCFGACLMKKNNLMDENGKYTEAFEKVDFKKECKAEYGKDACETVGKLMACINEHDWMRRVIADAAKSS